MASIFKRPDGLNWFAAYSAADGRRIKVSTKSKDKKEAQRIADRLELDSREERDKRRAGASLNGINDAMQRATQLAVAGRLDAHAARDLVNDLLVAAGQETLDTVTNEVWCETWRTNKKGVVNARSFMKYEQVTREWLKFLNAKADKPLEAVTRADAIAYRDRLEKNGLAPRTANQTVKILRGVYLEAVEQGSLGRNPFAGVDSLREERGGARRVPFTNADVAALIKEADGDWEGMVILAATTGLRLMDAARLKWSNLDLKTKLISVKTAKTGAELELPIHPRFSKWLKAQTRGIGGAPVFPTLANKGGPGKSGLSMAFKRLMDRAGISSGVARQAEAKGKGRTTSQKSFHSLRHFAATQLAAAGVRAEIARQITGHADAEMHGKYINADSDVLREAVESIQLTS